MPPYELFYWPGIPGRGELIRLLFEESRTPYEDHAKDPSSVQALLALLANDADPRNPPVLAVPVLRHGDLLLSQTANILHYLAPRLGLAAASDAGEEEEEKERKRLQLNQIVLTILDGLVGEVHDTHHPISGGLYYADQKEEAVRRAKYTTQERIPKYLGYIQRILDGDASGQGPWLYGGCLTYADLVLFQSFDGILHSFPKTMAKLKKSGSYDGVFQLYDAVKERPNIKAYLNSERRVPYRDGVWRYYPELDQGGDEDEEGEEEEEEEGSKRKKLKATE